MGNPATVNPSYGRAHSDPPTNHLTNDLNHLRDVGTARAALPVVETYISLCTSPSYFAQGAWFGDILLSADFDKKQHSYADPLFYT